LKLNAACDRLIPEVITARTITTVSRIARDFFIINLLIFG